MSRLKQHRVRFCGVCTLAIWLSGNPGLVSARDQQPVKAVRLQKSFEHHLAFRRYTEAELNAMPVHSINIIAYSVNDHRPKWVHNIIRITRLDPHGRFAFQDIGAETKRAAVWVYGATEDAIELRYHTGCVLVELRPVRARSNALTIPPGMTAKSYANELLVRAHYFNEHTKTHDYDVIGGEKYNVNSLNSGLLRAVGGATAVKDMNHFFGRDARSREVTEPLLLDQNAPRVKDSVERKWANAVARNAYVATGEENLPLRSEYYPAGF